MIPASFLFLLSNTFRISSGIEMVDNSINEYLGDHYYEGVTVPTDAGSSFMSIVTMAWIIGMAIMLLYTAISYLRIVKKVKEATPLKENIWICDNISTPFILGVVKPRIFIPSSINDEDLKFVIAHEKAHIKRGDHLWKPLGFMLLTIYWFNPLLWVAYILLCRDIELACDEKVIKQMGAEIKKSYSEALIN